MVVGLGTGSTAGFAIRALCKKVRAGLHIKAVASSLASERLAAESGIQIVDFADISRIDITIDGADEADKNYNLIKEVVAPCCGKKFLLTTAGSL